MKNMRISSFNIKTFLKRAFTENTGLKLLALVISLGLFMAVRVQEKVQRWVDVDVEIVMPDTKLSLALANKPISTVRVHVKGRHSIVSEIKKDTHVVKMDLSKITKPGLSTFFFEPEMFNFKGVDIIDINPEAVSVRIEKIISRQIPVSVQTVGSLKYGTIFKGKPVIIPSSVVATGPASVIRSVTSLKTEEIGIDDLAVSKYSEDVPLVPVEGLKYNNDRFTVKFEVIERRGQRMVSGLLVQSGVDGQIPVKIKPAEVAASFVGSQSMLDTLDPSLIIPKVVLTDEQIAKPGKYRTRVVITGLADGIDVKTIVPSFVEVDISK